APPAPEVAPPAAAAPEEAEVFQLNRMQQFIARRMVQSKVELPHFYVTTEIDMTEAGTFRRALNEALAGETSVTFNDLVLKAVALTLRRFPAVNATWDNGRLLVHRRVNVGFAVAMAEERGPGGLVVPVIPDADQKSLRQIATETKELGEKARAGRITERELAGATFSISNLGMFGVDQFTAIISPPQSAILAVGAIGKKPVVQDDQIVVRDRMRVTLSVDHRVFYGATAAQFLQELKRILERPMMLM
ncbi:MAG: 2-oxo acid dehydrogenase subunit E2, partial [Chloroflexi bacterium]|nr:2-oxo acid dehydrogenase subunit E2 [Chloroflexota bacterium]